MEKLITFLKSLPLVWRIIVVTVLAVVVIASTMTSCVMINSSLKGSVSPPTLDSVVHQRDTILSL